MPIFGWEGLKKQNGERKKSNGENNDTPATKCGKCGEILIKKALEGNLGVCPHCDHHHRLGVHQRVELTLDAGTFEEMDADLASADPLAFTGVKSYADKLYEAQLSTGMLSAMLSGMGSLLGHRVAFGATDSTFIMGSMGSVVGEKFCRLAERALDENAPMIIISGSGGGARMYEGLFSLMQMAKTSAMIGRLHEKGIPYFSIVTDCTMAGVWASWASLGDVIIAEPRALIGFTGPRVIKTTINCELPEGFQLSEFLLEHGQIDRIVHRRELRATIGSMLNLIRGEPAVVPATDTAVS
jgi:acetyl-CoA carboxylase carboxyl transferase subunit beta